MKPSGTPLCARCGLRVRHSIPGARFRLGQIGAGSGRGLPPRGGANRLRGTYLAASWSLDAAYWAQRPGGQPRNLHKTQAGRP